MTSAFPCTIPQTRPTKLALVGGKGEEMRFVSHSHIKSRSDLDKSLLTGTVLVIVTEVQVDCPAEL